MKQYVMGIDGGTGGTVSYTHLGEVAYTGDALVCTGQMSGFSSILPGVEASDTLLLENKSGATANFYMYPAPAAPAFSRVLRTSVFM